MAVHETDRRAVQALDETQISGLARSEADLDPKQANARASLRMKKLAKGTICCAYPFRSRRAREFNRHPVHKWGAPFLLRLGGGVGGVRRAQVGKGTRTCSQPRRNTLSQ